MSDYLFDPRAGAETDPEVAELEALLGGFAHDEPLDELNAAPQTAFEDRRRETRLAWAAVAVALAATVLFLLLKPSPAVEAPRIAHSTPPGPVEPVPVELPPPHGDAPFPAEGSCMVEGDEAASMRPVTPGPGCRLGRTHDGGWAAVDTQDPPEGCDYDLRVAGDGAADLRVHRGTVILVVGDEELTVTAGNGLRLGPTGQVEPAVP